MTPIFRRAVGGTTACLLALAIPVALAAPAQAATPGSSCTITITIVGRAPLTLPGTVSADGGFCNPNLPLRLGSTVKPNAFPCGSNSTVSVKFPGVALPTVGQVVTSCRT